MRQLIHKPNGIVIVTGPTGSGKTTTLYSALRELNDVSAKLITAEDPVEYDIDGIIQCQIKPEIELTFARILRSMLRQDPDIVLVGEIRDNETATIAIEAALTGHLLLSTLHTNDAPSAITRMTEIGCEPFLVATALQAVVAQRLARKLCTHCKIPYTENAETLRQLHFPHEPNDPPQLYRTGGCPSCSGTGYRGRIALHEVMTMSDELQQLVTTHATGSVMRQVAIEQGMVPLRDDGWSKVTQGLTTIEEVLRVSV
jgi:type IV pilus assembly protein PilB